MLTNTWIKKHMEVLSGQIDNTVYEKLDIFQDVEVVGELPNVPISSPITGNDTYHVCYSENGEFYYNFSPYDTKDIYIEKRNTQTHEIVASITTITGSIRTLIGGYERDGNLYLCTHSQHSGGQKDWYFVVDIYDAETLEVINYAYGGSQFQHIGTSATGTGFRPLGTFYHFSKNVDYIFFWNSYSDGSDPAVIRIDYTSIDEDHNAWTHFYSTNAGVGVTTEDAINGIVVENYEDPTQVKLQVRLYYIDGFVTSDWQTDGTAQAYLRVDFKDFDQEEFINESNYKFLDISSLSSGLNDPEDKANGIVFGKNNQSCVFKYNLADINIDSYLQFYCKINFNDWTTQWWPHAPLDVDGNEEFSDFIGLNPTFSKNKDLMFAVGIVDGNFTPSANLHLHVINTETMDTISTHAITDFQVLEPTYDIRSGKGALSFANNDKTIMTYTGGRFSQNSGVELVTQTIEIDTDLSIGTNTIEGLNIIEHSYGIGQKPLDPNDTKLEEEIERKSLLNKFIYGNLFVSRTDLLENELNGFNLYEFGTQSQNNILVSRDSINRYKDESIIMSFEKQIRNIGKNNRETKYMQNELTKFYSGVGVLENLKINALEVLFDDTVITTALPSLVEHKGDTELELTFTITTTNPVDINRFRLVNTLNVPLQDIMLAATRHLKGESEYTFKIRLKGEEI